MPANGYSSELFSYFSCSRVQVRAVCGATYMLNQDEELWEKELPPAVEQLLSEAKDPLADRSDRCKHIGTAYSNPGPWNPLIRSNF